MTERRLRSIQSDDLYTTSYLAVSTCSKCLFCFQHSHKTQHLRELRRARAFAETNDEEDEEAESGQSAGQWSWSARTQKPLGLYLETTQRGANFCTVLFLSVHSPLHISNAWFYLFYPTCVSKAQFCSWSEITMFANNVAFGSVKAYYRCAQITQVKDSELNQSLVCVNNWMSWHCGCEARPVLQFNTILLNWHL